MKKRIIACIAAAFMLIAVVFTLTACGSGETSYTKKFDKAIESNMELLNNMQTGQVSENPDEHKKYIKVNDQALAFELTDLQRSDALLTDIYGVFCDSNGSYLFLQRVYTNTGKNSLAVYHVNSEKQSYAMLFYFPEITVGEKTTAMADYLSKHSGSIYTNTELVSEGVYKTNQLMHRQDGLLLTTNDMVTTKKGGTTTVETVSYFNDDGNNVEIAEIEYTYNDKEETIDVIDSLMQSENIITYKMKDGKPDLSTFKVEEIKLADKNDQNSSQAENK